MASDGNRHVKVHLNCPNCRANISSSIEGTIRLRRKALSEALQNVPDSELSAKDLQAKYWTEKDGILFDEEGKPHTNGAKPLDIDPTLFGGLDSVMTEQEQRYVTKLMTSGYADQLCQAAQILSGIAENLRNGRGSSVRNTPSDNAPSPSNNNNTNNNSPQSAAANTARTTAALQQAANPNMRHGYSNAGIRTNRSRDGERETHVSNFQKQMEEKQREKLRRPLPARMPLCVSLSTAEFEKMALKSRQQAEALESPPEPPREWLRVLLRRGVGLVRDGGVSMTLVDVEWDGTVADAFARARISTSNEGNREQHIVKARVGPTNPVEQIGVKKILSMSEGEGSEERMPPTRSQRVLVGSVRGQAGKSGIMRGDVVTHVNGEVFTGDAASLEAMLVNAFELQGKDGVVMIVVNAEECTAEALRLRSRVR